MWRHIFKENNKYCRLQLYTQACKLSNFHIRTSISIFSSFIFSQICTTTRTTTFICYIFKLPAYFYLYYLKWKIIESMGIEISSSLVDCLFLQLITKWITVENRKLFPQKEIKSLGKRFTDLNLKCICGQSEDLVPPKYLLTN